ncbi:MAG: hypothetical protein EBR30_04105 [Cytophagia bacterium]|nr:hypothetical protein [Cytophagia bacterium]
MTIQALTASQINSLTATPYDTLTGPLSITNGGIGTFSTITAIDHTYDHTYQGKMVTAQHTVSDVDVEMLKMNMGDFKDMIKKELLHKLLDEIVKSNLIEFTSQSDVASAHTHYRARIYATPDSQVRMIRKSMK